MHCQTLLIALLAFAPSRGEPKPITATSRISGEFYVVEFTKEMAANGPQWKDDEESPPLSPRRAMQLAMKTAKTLFDDRNFSVRSLSLVPWANEGWVWCVSLSANEEGQEQPDLLYLLVLMDGTVPEPAKTYGPGTTGYQPPQERQKSTLRGTKKPPISK